MEKSSLQNVIRVLLVDDDEEDYIIIKHLFLGMREQITKLDWASSSDEAIAAIENPSITGELYSIFNPIFRKNLWFIGRFLKKLFAN